MADQIRAIALADAARLVRNERDRRRYRREGDCGLCIDEEKPHVDALGQVARELDLLAAAASPSARERLARHLYLTTSGDPNAQPHWDHGGDQHVNRADWLAKADAALAAITDREDH
ncbi:hypothetical protein [Verrucosispora sp. NA02020]|uniref:hypothetical protein n=1 Tax=Verrucosispora sp. NA02020 TaxID=2742132 RepID=UPI00159019BD|nr:hypothetical protein [Verrucosispora sp. NA02020]QKW15423.1 hypothetical protein HUT12_23425 [Verrucosispora sp. NA02020]